MRTIRPLKDGVLVLQRAPKEKLESGLFIPQGSRDLYEDVGTVIAVGPGRIGESGRIIPVSVKVGDVVSFRRRPGSALGDADPEWKDLLMLKDEDIVGVIE